MIDSALMTTTQTARWWWHLTAEIAGEARVLLSWSE